MCFIESFTIASLCCLLTQILAEHHETVSIHGAQSMIAWWYVILTEHYDIQYLLFLLLHMVSSGTHNLFFIYGSQILLPIESIIMGCTQIPATFLLQYTSLAGMYPGHGNVLEIVGAVIVFVGNLLMPIFIYASCYKTRSDLWSV